MGLAFSRIAQGVPLLRLVSEEDIFMLLCRFYIGRIQLAAFLLPKERHCFYEALFANKASKQCSTQEFLLLLPKSYYNLSSITDAQA